MEIIECRSPADIQDDDVTQAHSDCVRLLADWIYAGVCSGYAFTGRKRIGMEAIKSQCEAVMLGEKEYRKVFPHGAGFMLTCVIAHVR